MAAQEDPIQQAICPILVGRAEELRLLDAGLVATRRQQGQTYVLAGDAGIGKTRLATEVRDRAANSGMACLWGGCSEADLSLPYLPFLQAFGSYLAAADLEEVTRTLGPLAGDLARLFPQLHSAPVAGLDGDANAAKVRLFESVVALLWIATTPRGGLLVVEDLHWADSATRELVDYIARRVAGTHVMLLLTCRSDELHRRHPLQPFVEDWRRRPDTTVVDLRPLGAVDVGVMVQAIFQSSGVKDEFRDLIHSRTAGNPFVIEEMLKDALDRGEIFQTAAGWDRKPVPELRLPQRVRDAILARFERQPALQQDLLRVAAVLGRPAAYELLSELLDEANTEIGPALADCMRQQFLFRDDSGLYAFRHALTREAVSDDMIPHDRRAMHARVAAVLAKQRDADEVEICHHMFAAEAWSDAVPLALEVAERATAIAAYREAASLYERVLPHVAEPARRVEIFRLLSHRLSDLQEWARAVRYLEAEIPILERAGEMAGAMSLRLGLAQAYGFIGRRDMRLVETRKALDYLEAQGPSGDLADIYRLLAVHYLVDYQCREGRDAARRAVEIATQVEDRERLIDAYHQLGAHTFQLGDPEQGFAYFDRAIEMALERRRFGSMASALGNEIEALLWDFQFEKAAGRVDLWRKSIPETARPRSMIREGMVSWRLGALERAVAEYETHIRQHRVWGGITSATEAEFYLAVALAELGRVDESARILARTSPLTNEHRLLEAWIRMRSCLDSGDIAGARAATDLVSEAAGWPLRPRRWLAEMATEVLLAAGDVKRATEVVESIDRAPADPYQMRMAGRLALARGDHQLARDHFAAAAEFWAEIGGRLEEARSRRLLGLTLSRLDDTPGATEQMRRAYFAATRCGAATEARLAKEELTRLGEVTEPTVGQVKAALEVLHQPGAMDESALLATISLSRDIDAARLRDALQAEVRELASGPAGEDSEAGKVLLNCYVNRVGSHEVVAERLHLSRRTFYRRLDRGLLILAQRLGQIRLPLPI
jgi:tetratricopeptide (TPR) repeat protein